MRPLMVGGATSMYCGCAAPPPAWWKQRYGVNLDEEVSETVEELEIAPLPAELRGAASTRIAQAAQALGYDWQPQLKFMRPARAKKIREVCGAKCMLGCRCGVKVGNPAFDVAPAKYVTGIVTENGIAYPPFEVIPK